MNELKEEFKKIAWLSKKDITKQTVIVLTAVIIIAVIILFADLGIQTGIDRLINI